MKLNYNQKSVINLSLIAVIILSFYPPWQYSVVYSTEQVNPDVIDGGYHFVFSNPEFDDLNAYIIEQGIDYKKVVYHIGQLLLLFGLFFVGFSGTFSHNSNKIKQTEKDTDQGIQSTTGAVNLIRAIGTFLLVTSVIGLIYLTYSLVVSNYKSDSIGFFIGYYSTPLICMIIGYFMIGYKK